MARFFFDIFNGDGATPDNDGLELEDQRLAKVIAVDSVRSIVAEEARMGVIDLAGRIEVKDGGGEVLLVVNYAEAFKLRLPDGSVRQ